jgi:hypothetical protein
MASNKKYEYELEQTGDTWSAKVTRKINSRKRATTKKKADFKSKEEAQAWAEDLLTELTSKQKNSNLAHGQKRKDSEEIKRLRSARRAEKTELAKEQAAKLAEQEAAINDAIEESELADN